MPSHTWPLTHAGPQAVGQGFLVALWRSRDWVYLVDCHRNPHCNPPRSTTISLSGAAAAPMTYRGIGRSSRECTSWSGAGDRAQRPSCTRATNLSGSSGSGDRRTPRVRTIQKRPSIAFSPPRVKGTNAQHSRARRRVLTRCRWEASCPPLKPGCSRVRELAGTDGAGRRGPARRPPRAAATTNCRSRSPRRRPG
jgi:hypothetical protein